MQVVIVTGMSGAGKSTVMKIMEDIGFFCIDNLPLDLMDKFIELAGPDGNRFHRVAVSVDVRNGTSLVHASEVVQDLKKRNLDVKVLFLDASDEVLIKRFKETRRTHPLAGSGRLDRGIEKERQMLENLRDQSDYIIDTSQLLTRDLKSEIEKIFLEGSQYTNLYITILSFGFKYGIPSDSDLVFDVRFLPNPYYVDNLRRKTGNDRDVQDYVMSSPNAETFLDKLEDMLRFLIPNYVSEGKNQLVISIGCTGGRHRSVTLANGIYRRLQNNASYGLKIEHRDLEKDPARGK